MKAKYNLFKWIIIPVWAFVTIGCSGRKSDDGEKVKSFNFNDTVKIDSTLAVVDTTKNMLRIAVAAITSPNETFTYYKEMFKYIEEKSGLKVSVIQRKTYEEVNQLSKLNKVDIAFVCSGGYVKGLADSAFKLLVIPEREGKRKYQAYIIVNIKSGIKSLEDLKGKRFAFTDPLSTAGKFYPQMKLKEFGVIPCDYFSHTIYTYAHDNSIQLVAKQMVDGAAVNSLVFDYLVKNSPERVKNITIIDKSGWYAMPPVVISNGVPKELREKLETIFLNIHKDENSKRVLEKLMVDRYVIESDTLFSSVRRMVDFINE